MNLRAWSEKQGEQQKKHTAVMYMAEDGLKTISWESFLEDVERTIGIMEERKGQRICLLGENSYVYLVCFLAVIGSGNTAVPLNRDLETALLAQQIEEAEGVLILADKENMEKGKKLPIPCADMKEIIEKGGKGIRKPILSIPGEKEACILFSSGTGGRSKAVILSQENLMESLIPAKPNAGGGILLCMPLHHIGGIKTALHEFDGGQYLCICPNMKCFFPVIHAMRPVSMLLVPSMLEMLINRGRKNSQVADYLKNHLERIYCVGAFLRPELEEACTEFGIEVYNCYGLTETAGPVTDHESSKKGTVGRIAPWNQVKIVDEEILVKGRNVACGYLGDQDGEIQEEDGWFHTGDLGEIDPEGFLFLKGRKKNIIILENGENVNPEELERELSKCSLVKETLVYEEEGKICAEIYCGTLTGEEKVAYEGRVSEFINRMNRSLPMYRRIRTIKFRDTEFEKTSSMKLKRRK